MIITNTKPTNVCKNFTDGIAYFAAFCALVVVVIARAKFKVSEEYAHFYDVESTMFLIKTAAVFLVSALCGSLTRRIAPVGLAVSVVPVWYVFYALAEDKITLHPMIYVVFALVHLAGSLIYMYQWVEGREGSTEKRRSVICSVIACIVAVLGLGISLGSRYFASGETVGLLSPPITLFLLSGIITGLSGVYTAYRGRKNGSLSDPYCLVFPLSGTAACTCSLLTMIIMSVII